MGYDRSRSSQATVQRWRPAHSRRTVQVLVVISAATPASRLLEYIFFTVLRL
ncbi:hypothetical protein ARMSODRAFT_949618 [Armillaria solidipes]|uniref:Uncharacterized protein n=1 Tax=Armillaria solidipes TaxID=1076256 RepID=A0A2H3C7X0_9AGAR|nr:hypothetical protein ARMSODRAFT_949618 [Armillaria solidipes]